MTESVLTEGQIRRDRVSEFLSQCISGVSIPAPLWSHGWLITWCSISKKWDRMIVLVRERRTQTQTQNTHIYRQSDTEGVSSWLSSMGVTTVMVWISRWQKAGRLGDKSLIGCCVWIPWLSLSSLPSLSLGLNVSVHTVKCLQDGNENWGYN